MNLSKLLSHLIGVLTLELTGCIHLHRKAPVAPPEVAASIPFPEWGQDATTTIEGPQLKALQIAMDDFRPPGKEPSGDADGLTRCLQRVENYDVWLRRGEKVTFIHFTPQEERCGLEPLLMDAGASYAVSDEGVILRRE